MAARRTTTAGTALVTGASSGIGRELAALLARDGFDLVLVARDAERLERVAEDLCAAHGVRARTIAADLSEPSAVDGIGQRLDEAGIEVDVLVNNAGFNVYGPFAETDGARESAMVQVHVVAPTRLAKLLLPGMVRRGRGRILNVGSTGSFSPGPFDAVYCASKAYVLSLSEALAEELAGTGVTVTALCPGPTATAFAERAGMTDVRMFQAGTADAAAVAEAGYRALMRGRRVVVPGLTNKLLVFSVRLSPRRVVTAVGKRMLSRVGAASAAYALTRVSR